MSLFTITNITSHLFFITKFLNFSKLIIKSIRILSYDIPTNFLYLNLPYFVEVT